MPITRGNPPGMKNVRATVYNHYVRVDQPKSMIFVSGQVSRDSDGQQVGLGSMLEQTRQLGLAENAAGLDIAEQVLEVTHALRQGLHLAQAAMHLLEPLGHMGKAGVQPGLQGALQLLVDGGTHLLELAFIALLQQRQALLNG